MRCLERLMRRAGLALGFSQGFHPKPRMTFPLALAVGIEGVEEVMEVELAESYTAEELLRRLAPQAPAGLDVPRPSKSSPRAARRPGPEARATKRPSPRRAKRAWASGSSVCWPRPRARSSVRMGGRRSTCVRSCRSWRCARACFRCGFAWTTAAAALGRATSWPRWAWPNSSRRASVCAARPWRFAHDFAALSPPRPAADAYWSVLPNKKAAL